MLLPNDGNGNTLIIAEHVRLSSAFAWHTSNYFVLLQNSVARGAMNNWFNDPDNVSEEIRSRALNYEFQNNDGNAIPRTTVATRTGVELATTATSLQTEAATHQLRAITKPVGVAGSDESEPFILSSTEVHYYFPEHAPITVENFINLIEGEFYDGLTFHRIIDEFMIQGGDPVGNGTGGSDETIIGEFANNDAENRLQHIRGAVSMARLGQDFNSASSQFFIMQ